MASSQNVEMPVFSVSEQTVDDVDAATLRHEEWMRDQRVKIDRCVIMFKVKKEDLEQCEKKEVALLVRAPRASARERRDMQRTIDENKVLVLRHRQVEQTCKESLADAVREFQEKCK